MAKDKRAETAEGFMTAKVLPITANAKTWKRVSDNLILHAPTGMYYARKRKKGKTDLFASTGYKVKIRAQSEADLMVAEWLGLKHTGKRIRVEQVCDELLIALEKDTKPRPNQNAPSRRASTHAKDKWYLPKIKELFGDAFLDEVDESFFDRWVRSDGVAMNRSLFDIWKYLSKVLTYSYRKGYINRKPFIQNPDSPKKTGKKYDDELVQKFVDHANPNLRDLLILICENPLRPWEAKRMEWSSVQLKKDHAILVLETTHTKNKKRREIRLSQNAFCVLKRRKAQGSVFVFPSPEDIDRPVSDVRVGRWWQRMLKDACLPQEYKFHWLRHTFYSRALLDAKIPVALVSEAGGTSIMTLQKNYIHASAEHTKVVTGVVNLKVSGEKTVKKSLSKKVSL